MGRPVEAEAEAAREQGEIAEKVRQLENRAETWDEAARSIIAMEAKLDGALRASKIVGGLIGTVLTLGISAAGFLLALLSR